MIIVYDVSISISCLKKPNWTLNFQFKDVWRKSAVLRLITTAKGAEIYMSLSYSDSISFLAIVIMVANICFVKVMYLLILQLSAEISPSKNEIHNSAYLLQSWKEPYRGTCLISPTFSGICASLQKPPWDPQDKSLGQVFSNWVPASPENLNHILSCVSSLSQL